MLKYLEKKLKYLKNPKLLIPAIVNKIVIKYGIYKHKYVYWATYRNMLKITQNCEGLISPIDTTYLYKAVLKNRKEGDILDFGSYKGLSTSILSQAAAEIKRNVIAFESFQGLPPPGELDDKSFRKGDYRAAKIEFERNIQKWGKPENIKLIIGDCQETLKEEIKLKKITRYSLAFIDVDLYAVIKNILFLLDIINEGREIICIHDIRSPGVQRAIKEFMNSCKNKVSIHHQPATSIAELIIKNKK